MNFSKETAEDFRKIILFMAEYYNKLLGVNLNKISEHIGKSASETKYIIEEQMTEYKLIVGKNTNMLNLSEYGMKISNIIKNETIWSKELTACVNAGIISWPYIINAVEKAARQSIDDELAK